MTSSPRAVILPAHLKADIEANGLEQPIDAAPDGTVLDGHSRYLACRALGWAEVPVRIREDLDTRERRAARVIRSSLMRRQLTTAQKAALVIKLAEVRGLPLTVAAGLTSCLDDLRHAPLVNRGAWHEARRDRLQPRG